MATTIENGLSCIVVRSYRYQVVEPTLVALNPIDKLAHKHQRTMQRKTPLIFQNQVENDRLKTLTELFPANPQDLWIPFFLWCGRNSIANFG